MGTTLIFVGQWMCDGCRKLFGLIGLRRAAKASQEIASTLTVPETDTGGLVENT